MTKWWSVLPVILLGAYLQITQPDPIKSLGYLYYDTLHSTVEEVNVDDIVLVNIDERAIQKEGQYPWPRDSIAKYLTDAPEGNLYVLNVLYSEPDRFGKDLDLAQALANKAVVLSSAPTNQLSDGVGTFVGVATLGDQNHESLYSFKGLLYPISDLSNMSFGVGATVALPDQPTGVVRRAPLVIRANGTQYPSLALDTTRVFAGEPSYQMKVGSNGVEWVRIGRQPPITTNSYAELNIAFWNKFKQISILDLPNENTQGKIYILGITAEGYTNPVPTPKGGLYPHEVQGHLIHTLMTGVQIQEPDWTGVASLGALLGLSLGILVAVYVAPTILAALISIGLIAFAIGGSYVLWTESLLFFDVSFLILISLIVFGQSSFNKYYTTFKQKEQIRKQFCTYLSPDMVKMLQEDPSLLKLGGERREMSFMFMDICGFTPISEHYKNNDDPEGLVELVNKFLDLQTKIILNNNGTVDKYMGDCIMAFWNAPLPCENHADMAIKTSIEIIEATRKLNEELKPLNLPPINVGIGVNTGDCIVGNMGSEVRFDYSVIGDAVNLAARLEGQTRNYEGVDLLLSQFSREASTEGKFTEVDRIQVKGKTEKVTVYTSS
jgi:adenylate cyclase